MNKKSANITPLTKEDLEIVLDQKLDQKLKNYPTKKDLNQRFDKFAIAFRAETDHKVSTMMEDFRLEMSKFTNRILTALDPLIKDMEIRREEREIASNQMLDVTDRLDSHEKRLQKLETS